MVGLIVTTRRRLRAAEGPPARNQIKVIGFDGDRSQRAAQGQDSIAGPWCSSVRVGLPGHEDMASSRGRQVLDPRGQADDVPTTIIDQSHVDGYNNEQANY